MKLDTKTALGIDISEDRISMALLRRSTKGVELLKSASGPVPAGAIKDGNIEDPALLAKGIKDLKTRSRIRIRLRQAAVSLVAKPMLVQIIDTPKQFPTNISQFIQNELKHCVALSGKKIALDFCGISSSGRSGGSRLFVVASDSQRIANLVKACGLARVNLEAVEPALLSFVRSLYAKKIARKFEHNLLTAILRDKTLTLCVFKKQMLDFVRTRYINAEKNEPSDFCQWLSEEINALIQFYNIEVSDSTINWEITIFTDGAQLQKEAEEALLAKITAPPQADVQIRGPENICQDISVTEKGGPIKTAASAVAIGLAMKLLVPDGSNLRINLIPPEAAEVKSLKKHTLITANIIAAVLFIMVLAIGALMMRIEKLNENIMRKKQGQSMQKISELVQEDQTLDRRMKQLSEGPGRLKEIVSSRRDSDWFGLLNDLRSRAPKNVRITNLSSKGDSLMSLEGLALSYEAVHLFVNMLDQSEHVTSASLIEAEKDNEGDGYIKYAISCAIAPKEGK
jgi:Tfp pilus assembly protein PilN